MSPALQHLSPDAAVMLLTVGILLIYVELNRPGPVLPGAAGLLAALLAIAALLAHTLSATALLLIALGTLILTLGLRFRTPVLLSITATLCLILGLLRLVAGDGNRRVHPAAAIGSGVILGAGTTILTRIALRARRNKGLDLQRARTSRPGAFKS